MSSGTPGRARTEREPAEPPGPAGPRGGDGGRIALDRDTAELRRRYGLRPEDLNLDLGPLGPLLPPADAAE
ncbi:hypothetical protein D7294_09900 [Streptomyces hoynatensis]|uniref:Uncharacterized protein n=1 Tax=Streptomyces hoynatensis TaxID=1141874 RepID=A0A3A9Z6T8_9ACTN|nr:hypothetical protein D7294_09900 [Streptomyces hoynatensis]